MSRTCYCLCKFFKDPQIPVLGGMMVMLPLLPILIPALVLETLFHDIPRAIVWVFKSSTKTSKTST